MDGDIVEKLVVVAYLHIFVDDAEWADDIAIAQFCLRVYNC